LAGIPRETLLHQVAEFAEHNYLSDITPLLQRGALVAQDPANWENVPGLTEAEKSALDAEVTHKWRQPRAMYMTVILCSIGAAVQYVSPVSKRCFKQATNAHAGVGIKPAPTVPICRGPLISAFLTVTMLPLDPFLASIMPTISGLLVS